MRKRAELPSEEDVDLVAEYLESLSAEWENASAFNLEFAVSEATRYFKRRSLSRLQEEIGAAIESGDTEAAEGMVADYRRVEAPGGDIVRIYRHDVAVTSAFMEEEEQLFKLPGALGEGIGPFLRGDFFAVLGTMKRGKSWWMLFVAYRASIVGLRAVFFSLEMTRSQSIRRSWMMVKGQPRFAKKIEVPTFRKDGDTYYIDHEAIPFEGIDPSQIREEQKKIRTQIRSGDLRIETFPAYSATVSDIERSLDNLAHYEGFYPDVIVVDYADIVAPESRDREYRHQIDGIWKRLRSIAQSRNCLVVTASQGTRATLRKDAAASDIAEDVRKLAHVTNLIALNQDAEEKREGVMRIAHLLHRDRGLSKEIIVLQSLETGRPYIDSRFLDEVDHEVRKGGEEDEKS